MSIGSTSGIGGSGDSRAGSSGQNPPAPMSTHKTEEDRSSLSELSKKPEIIDKDILEQELAAITDTDKNGALKLNAKKFKNIYSSLQDNGPFSISKAFAILVYFLSDKTVTLTDENIDTKSKASKVKDKELKEQGNNIDTVLDKIKDQYQSREHTDNWASLTLIKKVNDPIVIALNCIPLITKEDVKDDMTIEDFVDFLNFLRDNINNKS